MSFCCIALLIIILGMGLYILYDKGYLFSSSNQDENTSLKECDPCVCDGKLEEIQKIDLSKVINPSTKDSKYSLYDEYLDNWYGLSMKINDDKKSATLRMNWEVLGSYTYHPEWKNKEKKIDSYFITGFTKEIESVFFGFIGQTYPENGTYLFFIMEDGTLEYLELWNNHESNSCLLAPLNCKSDEKNTPYLATQGKVEGVRDVIRLYNANHYIIGGTGTVLAAKKDGSFYDLGNIIATNH